MILSEIIWFCIGAIASLVLGGAIGWLVFYHIVTRGGRR